MNTTKHLIAQGSLRVVGKNSAGEEVVFEGDVKDFELDIEKPDYYIYTTNTSNQFLPSSTPKVTLRGEVKGQYKITYPELTAPKVTRTARVLGWEDNFGEERREATIALIRAAAEKAGVDENTSYHVEYEKDSLRGIRKAWVEFRWSE